jgi:hypothetical protein
MLMGSLTIPGRPERLHAARAFVAQAPGGGCCPCMEIAVLLTSELVSNSLQYSESRRDVGWQRVANGLGLLPRMAGHFRNRPAAGLPLLP